MDTENTASPVPSLPSTSHFLTSLITQLVVFESRTIGDGPAHRTGTLPSRSQDLERGKNTLARLPATDLLRVKPLMLTLHCLFPNELLLALDILDRRLVRRLILRERRDIASAVEGISPPGRTQPVDSTLSPGQEDEEIYLVRSTSLSSARMGTPKSYEVRLRSWNCTCPAFALSAFRDLEDHVTGATAPSEREDIPFHLPCDETFWFGGTLTRDIPSSSQAVCKHLLACVLGTRCPSLFADGIGEMCTVTPMELAGLCAGWVG
jgi:hypothetical protein